MYNYMSVITNAPLDYELHFEQASISILPSKSLLPSKPCSNILIAHGGDSGAGFATLIYIYPINFLLYAKANGLILWLDYNPSFNDLYFDADYGPNPFEYYFQSINPEFCCNCNISAFPISKYHSLTKKEINPGIHKLEKSSIHAWYYHWRRQKIHRNANYFNESWFEKQRKIGSQIVIEYFHLKEEIKIERDHIWNEMFPDMKYIVLGVQMRGSDKVQRWSIRRKVRPNEYMPYIAQFLLYYGRRAKIFIATDDQNYLSFVEEHWTEYIQISNQTFANTVLTQNNVIRSSNRSAVFEFKHISKYEIGKQVLLDILLLSKCDWFIHSATAVAEAVFYNNFDLHEKSVHLEYTQGRQIPLWFTTI